MTESQKRSPLLIIFMTVMIDLIGFGMVIPLISLYGRHYGASTIELAILGSVYSLMQFFFAPFWGRLSDRVGRRPIILLSLAGSTLSYVIFAFAPSTYWLIASRALNGIFAANISAAQAYIADTTTPENRARGMGLIGAAFGIGFTLGPPLGGIAAAKLGLSAPGLIAAGICGLNLLAAFIRLPESLQPENQKEAQQTKLFSSVRNAPAFSLFPLLAKIRLQGALLPLILTFFFVTFAFSTMEQTFSLLFQNKFELPTGKAGYETGVILMAAGLLGAIIQGGMIKKLVARFQEWSLLLVGLGLNVIGMVFFPFGQTLWSYFLLMAPIAIGNSLINPCLNALISKSAPESSQGETLGLSQAMGSLARALGPFCGLLCFGVRPELPYLIASLISLGLILLLSRISNRSSSVQTTA